MNYLIILSYFLAALVAFVNSELLDNTIDHVVEHGKENYEYEEEMLSNNHRDKRSLIKGNRFQTDLVIPAEELDTQLEKVAADSSEAVQRVKRSLKGYQSETQGSWQNIPLNIPVGEARMTASREKRSFRDIVSSEEDSTGVKPRRHKHHHSRSQSGRAFSKNPSPYSASGEDDSWAATKRLLHRKRNHRAAEELSKSQVDQITIPSPSK